MTDLAAELKAVASDAKAWPFAEARDLAKRLDGMGHQGEVLFETGYGPSGLPHIGTFGEVVRTSMVRHAFEVMTGRKTRLVCFSDDMDGLAQGAGQCPQWRGDESRSRPAADGGPRPVRNAPLLWRAQQRPSSGLPRFLRV